MTLAAQEAQDIFTLIADIRAAENEACAKIIDAAAERQDTSYARSYSEQATAHITARNLRFLAAAIRARVTQ